LKTKKCGNSNDSSKLLQLMVGLKEYNDQHPLDRVDDAHYNKGRTNFA
jgi:hypothetical protein